MSKAKESATRLPSFDGPHLWIHHDATNRQALPHRRRVFSHIQGQYRPWRRREDYKTLKQTSRNTSSDEDSESRGSPTSIIAKGNSDPFRAYAIPIGPEENQLISFYREVFLPAQYGVRQRVADLDDPRKRDWDRSINGLADEGIAHGNFARWGQIMTRYSPGMRKEAIEHQARSLTILRRKILAGNDLQTPRDYLHITMLFAAETISRNLQGCLTHAKMLRHMFDESWKRGTLDYRLLTWQVHNVVQTSSMFLVRPPFDFYGFLPMVFGALWPKAALDIPLIDYANHNIDLAVEGALLQRFKETRTFWEMLQVRETAGMTDFNSQEAIIWCSSQELLHLGRLIDTYSDIKELLNRGDLTRKIRVQLMVQEYLSLAAIYLVKSMNLNPVLLGVPFFDSGPILLPNLVASLARNEEVSTQAEKEKYTNSRLWALYVGALAEQSFPKAGLEPSRQWFNIHFAKYAISMDLRSWDAVKRVLSGFLYSDRIPPNGSVWFEKTLICYQENLDPWKDVEMSMPGRIKEQVRFGLNPQARASLDPRLQRNCACMSRWRETWRILHEVSDSI